MNRRTKWKVKDKRRLLIAMIEAFGKEAQMSFEGDLSALSLQHLPQASQDETAVLKRSTLWPKQDFVVVTLDTVGIPQLIAAFGGTISSKILHIQMANQDQLLFGAYDNFRHVTFHAGVEDIFIEKLLTENIMIPLS